MLLHYVVKWTNAKMHFFLKSCIGALREVNQLLDFFNVFDSRLILTLLYDSLSLVSMRSAIGTVGVKGSQ